MKSHWSNNVIRSTGYVLFSDLALIFLLFLFSLLILFFLHLALIADSETQGADVLLLKTGHSGLNRPSRL